LATADATAYPIYGQAFRFSVPVKGSANNPITGGLTSLSVVISKDSASTLTSAAGTAAEIGTTGWADIDLTAADMTATKIIGEVRATNTGAVYACFEIKPLRIADSAGRALNDTVIRFENVLTQIWRRLFNKNFVNAGAGTATLYKDDSTTTLVSGTVSQTTDTATAGKMS